MKIKDAIDKRIRELETELQALRAASAALTGQPAAVRRSVQMQRTNDTQSFVKTAVSQGFSTVRAIADRTALSCRQAYRALNYGVTKGLYRKEGMNYFLV